MMTPTSDPKMTPTPTGDAEAGYAVGGVADAGDSEADLEADADVDADADADADIEVDADIPCDGPFIGDVCVDCGSTVGAIFIFEESGLDSVCTDDCALTINGSLTVLNTDAATLEGLECVVSVTGSLLIDNNDSLVDVTQLNNLTSVGGDFTVRGNFILPTSFAWDLVDAIEEGNIGGTITIENNGPCGSEPCLNGGTCSDVLGSFECECPEAVGGGLCQHDCRDDDLCTDEYYDSELGCQAPAVICDEPEDLCLTAACIPDRGCVDEVACADDDPCTVDLCAEGPGCASGDLEDGSCYEVVLDNLDFNEAEAACVLLGSHLVTISSEEENTLVRSLVSAGCGEGHTALIGFNDRESEGTFAWTSGEPVTYTNWDTAAGEPVGGHNKVDATWMQADGTWSNHDFDSGGAGCYVCEQAVGTVPLCDTSVETVTSGGHEFTLCDGLLDRDDARVACTGRGDRLAVVPAAGVSTDLQAAVGADGAWVDVSDEAEEGTWVWAEGSPDISFCPEQPSGGEAANCALMTDCGLDDVACGNTNAFLCEALD